MICDNCGKSNISGLSKCSYCGAEMPKASACGGFADILSYKPPAEKPYDMADRVVNENEAERMSDSDMQKLINKSDSIMKSTKVNSLFGLIAIGLSALILISSIVCGIVTVRTVKAYKEETLTQLEETNKELTEHKAQLAVLLKKIAEEDAIGEKADSVAVNAPEEAVEEVFETATEVNAEVEE